MADVIDYSNVSLTGNNLYFVLRTTDGRAVVASTGALQKLAAGNWGTYAIAATEVAGSGIFQAAVPTGIPLEMYIIEVRQRVGGSPAVGDTQPVEPQLKLWTRDRWVSTELTLPPWSAGYGT